MRIKQHFPMQLLILLIGCIPGLSACQTIEIKNRTPCFVNGEISLGSTCSNTIGTPVTVQLTTQETLDVLEAQPSLPDPNNPGHTLPAHPPGVFQSASDYGEETVELEQACRLLGKDCTYELQSTIENRKRLLNLLKVAPSSSPMRH